MLNDIKLLSGRVKKTPSTEIATIAPDRYEFIRLNDVEPDLGVPVSDNYILISNQLGQRNWVDVNSLVEGGFVPSGDIAKPQGQVVFGSGTGITTDSTFFWDDTNNRLGIGTSLPSAKIHSLATTEQLRLGYDAANYTTFTVDSTGDLTIVPSGGDVAVNGNISVTGHITTPIYIDFHLEPGTVVNQIGRLWYNTEDDTLNIGHDSGVVQQVGQEFFMPPCKATETIPNGSFVMAVGAQGDKITIAKAVTNGTVDPMYMVGVATHDITIDDEFAKIVTNGIIRDVNTNAWIVGTILYPDPTTPGGWTSTKPVSPAIKTAIAIVLRQNATTGRIYVRMTNGSVLGGTDSNVEFSNLANNDVVLYNSTNQRWENHQLSTFSGQISHTGLIPSEGFEIDQIKTISIQKTLTQDWQDTGITSTNLATGTYIVQLFANDTVNINEYYSGIMSWYSGNTQSSTEMPTDEIVLHRAGGSAEGIEIYLRTFRSPGASPDKLKLQIYSNHQFASNSSYVFKFRRMI